jgi:hypothetical protein
MTPSKWFALLGSVLLVCLSMCTNAWPGREELELAADIKALKDAGVATDESGLLEFFEKHTGSEDRRRLIEELIKQLGDGDFMVREKATRELEGLGAAARSALQQAKNHKDAEVASRAKRCLEAIGTGGHGKLVVRAARVLSTSKSAKAVEVLLAYLPDAADAGVEEDIIRAVRVLGVSEGKSHPALVQALTDKLPLRRGAAGEALAGLPDYAEAVLKLMQDAEPSVRLRVSLALVCSGDRKVVPALIDCLPQLTHDQAWQVEDVFYRLGGDKVPELPAGDDAAMRKKYRDECHAWWKEHGAMADLALLSDGPRRKAKVSSPASRTLDGRKVQFPVRSVPEGMRAFIGVLESCHASQESSDAAADLKKAQEGDHVRMVFAKPVKVEVLNKEYEMSELVYSKGVFWLRFGDKVQRCAKYEFEKWKPFEVWFRQTLPEG